MKKILSLLAVLLACASAQAQSWLSDVPEPEAYNDYTVVFAQLTTTNITSTDLVIGAFIDGKCRVSVSPDVDMSGAPVTTISGNPLYTIKVPGNLRTTINDSGKTISFKVYDPGTGLEYPLTNTVTFDGSTYGDPPSESALFFTLVAPTAYNLTLTEVEVGTEYTLTDYLSVDAGAVLPDNVTWSLSAGDPTAVVDLSNIVTITDGKLKATTTYDAPITLTLSGGSDLAGAPAELASCQFNIVLHATSIDLVTTTFEVSKDDYAAMDQFMRENTSYKLNPTGATDNVQWETEDPTILEWNGRGYFVPIKGGQTRMRPFILKDDGNGGTTKLVPMIGSSEGWITVTVKVPVTSIIADATLYGGTFTANVGDTHIYERLAKLITVAPDDATDKSYTVAVDASGVLKLSGTNTITAEQAGTGTITITAKGADPNAAPVTDYINVTVVEPTTQATINKNTLYINWEGADLDITEQIRQNVTLNGDQMRWDAAGTVTLTGDGVRADMTPCLSGTEVIGGQFTAYAEGTATITIDLRWPKYDTWGVSSDVLEYETSQASFQIVVQRYVGLAAFDIAITNPVAGENGTITLTPQPAGATFDINDIGITIDNGLFGGWHDALTVTKGSQTTTALVFNFTSTIPGTVSVSVTKKDQTDPTASDVPVPINGTTSTTTNYTFEIGYPVDLASGWQWRSNARGIVLPADFATFFTTAGLTEVRTSADLLYNDPNWGFYGTLSNSRGILEGQTYKVNMKADQQSVLYASSVTSDDQRLGTTDPTDGSLAVTLKPGWNWVGSPFLFDRLLNNILVSVPTELEGAVIVGKTATAELQSGIWKGDLKVMKAGEGYIIQNPTSSNVVINFKNEMTDFQPGHETTPAGVKGIDSFDKVWEYDHSRFMNNMSIVGTLEGVEHPDQYSIGAFVGDECRGEGIIEDGKAFITVHCDAGEFVTFKLYSPYTRDFYTIEEGLQAETRVGSLRAPFKLHAAGVVDGISATAVASPSGEANAAFDLNGRRAITNQRGITIRRTADGKTRKVIVK